MRSDLGQSLCVPYVLSDSRLNSSLKKKRLANYFLDSATNDYDTLGDRLGHRAVGIGEKPYLDPKSGSRTLSKEV